jgi:hypothetical protein
METTTFPKTFTYSMLPHKETMELYETLVNNGFSPRMSGGLLYVSYEDNPETYNKLASYGMPW